MFDLDHEVQAFCEAVHADHCRSGMPVAELQDHLYCEIDRLKAEGMSERQAFDIATQRLGDRQALAAEYEKNRSWFSRACRALMQHERAVSSKGDQTMVIAHSILWATLIIATALVLSENDSATTFGYLLPIVFLPLWFASDQLLRHALKSRVGE